MQRLRNGLETEKVKALMTSVIWPDAIYFGVISHEVSGLKI